MKKEMTIGEIVALDYRTAAVFKEAGIDFCCGGKEAVTDICLEKGIDLDNLMMKLEAIKSSSVADIHNYNDWEPGFLCDYIVNTHHKYVLKTMPEILSYTSKIAAVHGERHPELLQVAGLFSQISQELTQHLKNEEEVLFPAIKEVLISGSAKAGKTISSEILRLSGEHEFAGDAMDRISVLTDRYRVPDDACNTYSVALKLLDGFEDDLHTHVHLENNILFPKAMTSILKLKNHV